MASPDTLRAHAKSLHKRGMTTEKQHARMMAKIEAMAPMVAPASVGGAAPDPDMANAVTPAPAAAVPVTASVPVGQGNLPAPATPPAA